MPDYPQRFFELEEAVKHAEKYSRRENRPELPNEDPADLYVIQSRSIFFVSSSGYLDIYDQIKGHYSDGKKIS
jgi:hypothetical protein